MVKKKVLLVGEKDRPNLGDQLISFCLKKIIEKETDAEVVTHQFSAYVKCATNAKIIPVDYKRGKIRTFGFKKITKLLPPEIKQLSNLIGWAIRNKQNFIVGFLKLKESDVVIIGGGQLFLPNGIFPVSHLIWAVLSLVLKKKIVVMAVGCGKGFRFFDMVMCRFLLKNAAYISVRDVRSYDNMAKFLGVVPNNVIDDPVFLVSSFYKVNLICPSSNEYLVICPASYEGVFHKYNPKVSYEDYLKQHINYVKEIIKSKKIILTATNYEQDKNICNDLFEILKNIYECSILLIDSMKGLCEIIVYSYGVLSGRMHALIIAKSYGKRIFSIDLSEKMRAFSSTYSDCDINMAKISEAYKQILAESL